MSLNNPAAGQRSTYDAILTTTGEVTIYEITKQNVKATIESIYVSSDGTATDFTLTFKNGSTVLFQPYIANPVDSPILIADYHRTLRMGHKITAQAGTGNHLSVSIVLLEGGGN